MGCTRWEDMPRMRRAVDRENKGSALVGGPWGPLFTTNYHFVHRALLPDLRFHLATDPEARGTQFAPEVTPQQNKPRVEHHMPRVHFQTSLLCRIQGRVCRDFCEIFLLSLKNIKSFTSVFFSLGEAMLGLLVVFHSKTFLTFFHSISIIFIYNNKGVAENREISP